MSEIIYYKSVLSTEEALEREKDAFILEKTILKTICNEGPVSIADIRRKTVPLEAVLGYKIDLQMIQKVLQKYLNHGIIIVTKSKEV